MAQRILRPPLRTPVSHGIRLAATIGLPRLADFFGA
jgi:hypothetical protein